MWLTAYLTYIDHIDSTSLFKLIINIFIFRCDDPETQEYYYLLTEQLK